MIGDQMKEHSATNRLSDDELLAELGVSAEPPKSGGRTPREERIIAGFEDIQFYGAGRVPYFWKSMILTATAL